MEARGEKTLSALFCAEVLTTERRHGEERPEQDFYCP